MRIVVKVGTSTLAHATGALNIRRTAALCRVLADIKNAGHELVPANRRPLPWASAS